jgi:hypothetical protein
MPNNLQPLIEQGLIGAGTVAPMSQFQQALGTQLAGMTVPDQFALAEQAGQGRCVRTSGTVWVCKRLLKCRFVIYAMDPARQFSSAETTAYMSPYMQ